MSVLQCPALRKERPGPGLSEQRMVVHFPIPDGTVLYENLIKTCYYQTGVNPFGADEELRATIIAYYPIAKSTSKKKRQQMLAGLIRPTKKPDLDNVIKSILDALNKVAYHDDTQIVSLSMEKFYSDSPRVEVTINSI